MRHTASKSASSAFRFFRATERLDLGRPRASRLRQLESMFNEHAPIAKFTGMRLRFEDDGTCWFTLPFKEELTHAGGNLHGGVYATMLVRRSRALRARVSARPRAARRTTRRGSRARR